jgi:hypothetical protein
MQPVTEHIQHHKVEAEEQSERRKLLHADHPELEEADELHLDLRNAAGH